MLDSLVIFGNGSALSGVVLAAMAVFVIEQKLYHAAAFCVAGSVFTGLGFMHGERIGWTDHPQLAASYLIVALFLTGCGTFAKLPARSTVQETALTH